MVSGEKTNVDVSPEASSGVQHNGTVQSSTDPHHHAKALSVTAPDIQQGVLKPNTAIGVPQTGASSSGTSPTCPSPLTLTVTKLPFVPGHPAPPAPPGYEYVYVHQYRPIVIALCILMFPFGLIFLFCARERSWILQAEASPV